jgi:hypothetical protein
MTDSSNTSSTSSSGDRRTFLKVGAGVVGGLAVGAVVAYAAKGSTTTTTTETGTNTTETSTATVSGPTTTATVTGPTTTATTTATVTGPTTTATTTATVTGPATTSTVTSTTTSVNTSQIASLQSELQAYSGIADALITLSVQEAAVVSAAANVIIPADSNGPGAAEAGVIYFIDRQLWGEYGSNGRIYSQGPFISQGLAGPLTVNTPLGPIIYSGGTQVLAWGTPQRYEYPMNFRLFWRFGIEALEVYANQAYGGNFETLSAANQVACLSDLFNNKPTTFGTDSTGGNVILPSDFANELFYMTWCGFLMDPMYGGNRGLVGWKLTASPGLNSGNFYGEGETPIQRALASTPSIIGPVSNAQFQQSLKISGVLSP